MGGPAIVKAVDWLRRAREKDEYGLMPASWPYDAKAVFRYHRFAVIRCG